MKKYYFGHDRVYRKAKAAGGSPPWGDRIENTAIVEFASRHIDWRHKVGLASHSVLELGCGVGYNLLDLYRAGMSLEGIDISPAAIEWAQENAIAAGIPANFRVADVLDDGIFIDVSFDVVLDGHCFHCIIGQQDRKQFMVNAYRALKPGGSLVMETMIAPVCSAMASHTDERGVLIQNGIASRQIQTLDEIKMLLVDSGFSILELQVDKALPNEEQSTARIVGQK